MLFNELGQRCFEALQSNGQPRPVAYTIDHGQVLICSVDGIPVTAADPLPKQFEFVVLGWIEEHRANLHLHDEYRRAA